MTKDKWGIILALILQMAAVVWWASSIDTIVKAHKEELTSIHSQLQRMERIDARLDDMQQDADTLANKIDRYIEEDIKLRSEIAHANRR